MQLKQQQLELDMEQWTGSKLGKEYFKSVYCHPAYLTSLQSTSYEMLDWLNPCWNQDYWEKCQQPQTCRLCHPYGRKWDFPGGSEGKVPAYNAGDLGSIPGLGRSPGEGNGNPLQYSCLENPMDRRAW